VRRTVRTQTKSTLLSIDREFTNEVLENGMSLKHRRTSFTTRLLLLLLVIPIGLYLLLGHGSGWTWWVISLILGVFSALLLATGLSTFRVAIRTSCSFGVKMVAPR